MASKLQKRLVGTIILIILSITLLCLLDSKKKRVHSGLIIIPMLVNTNKSNKFTVLMDNQQLSRRMLEETSKLKKQCNQSTDNGHLISDHLPNVTSGNTHQLEILTLPKIKVNSSTVIKQDTKTALWFMHGLIPKLQTSKYKVLKPCILTSDMESTSNNKLVLKEQAWVIQLGALKNTGKVFEIIDKLRLFGYCVYTIPSVPISGQITKIFVGPDTSRDKLQSALNELKQLSGLNGRILYTTNF